MKSTLRFLIDSRLVWLFSVIVLTPIYYFFFSHVWQGSDAATILLEANDIVQGNIFLNHWTVAPDNYYTLDTLLYVLPVSIFGIQPLLMVWMPAFAYALFVTCAIFLMFQFNQGRNKYAGLLLLMLFLAIPPLSQLSSIGMSPCHIITLLYVLLSFWFFSKPFQCGNEKWGFFFLLLANIGDPLSYYIGNAPLILVSLMNGITHKENKRNVIFSLLSFLTSVIVIVLLRLSGFRIRHSDMVFVTLNQLPGHFSNIITGLLSTFNANFFGGSLAHLSTLLNLANFCILLVGGYFAFIVVRRCLETNEVYSVKERLLMFLAIGIVINIIACLLSALFIGQGTYRYLLPTLFYMSIMLSIILPTAISHKKGLIIALIFLVLGSGWITGKNLLSQTETKDAGLIQLISTLEENHLTNGYGGYWNANIITVMTKGQVMVRAIKQRPEDNGILSANNYNSNIQWYKNYPTNFLVYEDGNQEGVDEQSIVKTFGQPVKTITIGHRHLLIWDKDISSDLLVH